MSETSLHRNQSSISSPDEVDLMIEADAAQPLDFIPAKLPVRSHESPSVYLLTGATGFLGAYVLRDLLAADSSALVQCLVRAADEPTAQPRLQKNLQGLGISITAEQWERIVCIPGDLAEDKLSLTDSDYTALAAKTHTIIHCAARMNFYESYQQLRPINVGGALNLLKFAVTSTLKPIHYMSTTGVFDSEACRGDTVTEQDVPAHCRGSVIGYTETKWVAEQLFLRARKHGVPSTIYRAPFIMGDTQSGLVARENLVVSVIIGSIQGGAWPEVALPVEMIPVDSLSRAMVHFIRSLDPADQIYHLSSRKTINWSEGGHAAQAVGYLLEMMPSYHEWKKRLARFGREKDNALRLLLPLFVRTPRRHTSPSPEVFFRAPRPVLDCTETNRLLDSFGLTPPAITLELLTKYLQFFVAQGWLERPPTESVDASPSCPEPRPKNA